MAYPDTYARTYEASPSFAWSNTGSLITGAQAGASWQEYNAASGKYLPFNVTRIVNNSSSGVWFYPNQNTDAKIFLAKGTITTIDRSTLPALSSFLIENAESTTITASQIIITCSREGQSTDSVVARFHKRLFGERFGGRIV